MFYIFIGFALVSTAYSAIYIKAPCPDIKPISYLNITALSGSWYEIGRYPNDFESRGDCATTMLTPKDTGRAELKLIDIINHKQVVIEGFADYAPGAGTTGIMNYYASEFNATEGSQFLQLFFLNAVYDNYCVLYDCKYDETTKTRRDYAWVMARTSKLDKDSQKAVDAFLKSKSFIDSSKLSWDHFDPEACKVSS